MLLSEVKAMLPGLDSVVFQLEDGTLVPEHFHVTEVGIIERRFMDCGGVQRREAVVNFQLWHADDYEHRLKPAKLLHIISLAEGSLGINHDLPVEVEYQAATIGKYDLQFQDNSFVLVNKTTACLAPDKCGLPANGQTRNSLPTPDNAGICTPGSGCCS